MVGDGATCGCRQAAAGPFWAGKVAVSRVGSALGLCEGASVLKDEA